MSIVDDLITDRNSDDVLAVQTIAHKIKTGTATSDERAEYLGSEVTYAGITLLSGMKGAYNASDLNRVEEAQKLIGSYLYALENNLKQYASDLAVTWNVLWNPPYAYAAYEPFVNMVYAGYRLTSIPPATQMSTYLNRTETIKFAFGYTSDDFPQSMESLNFSGANAIEDALKQTYVRAVAWNDTVRAEIYAIAVQRNKIYSGEFYSGEVNC